MVPVYGYHIGLVLPKLTQEVLGFDSGVIIMKYGVHLKLNAILFCSSCTHGVGRAVDWTVPLGDPHPMGCVTHFKAYLVPLRDKNATQIAARFKFKNTDPKI